MAEKKKQKRIDWERLEPGWRANRVSVLQLATNYETETGQSVSHTAINKHFKKLGIKRDLREKVKNKADSLVSGASVSGSVSIETTATDAEIINAEALNVAQIQFGHRIDIPLKRELVAKLFAEVESQTDGKDLLEQLEIALGQGDTPALAKAVKKVTSLGSRTKIVGDLVRSYKDLIALERQAYSIGEGEGEKESTLGEFFKSLDGKTWGLPGG